jgi:hypothetical protein
MRTEFLGVMDLTSLGANQASRVVQETNQHKSKYYMRGLGVWFISKSIKVCLFFFLFDLCASVNGLFLNTISYVKDPNYGVRSSFIFTQLASSLLL